MLIDLVETYKKYNKGYDTVKHKGVIVQPFHANFIVDLSTGISNRCIFAA